MRIALLTIWHDGNYGAELQAYATIKMLKELGHDVEMIDIRLSDKNSPSIKGKIGSFISSFGPAARKFNKFWKNYFPTTRRYKSLKELQQDPPNADVYLVGSDQVWNPYITKQFTSLYFLDFGCDNVRRVSYASSFGNDHWMHPEITKDIKGLLDKFNSVSCREQSGINILSKEFSIQARNVLDPTLLFTNYKELTGELNDKQTLVYYPLSSFPLLSSYAESLANRLHLQAQNANWSKNVYGKIVWDRNSIEEWLKVIGEAAFVITPSFHGVAMSLIHKRQFAVIVTNKERATRINNILNHLGLEDRIYDSLEMLDKNKPWAKVIDYKSIDEKLKSLRLDSISYLKKALS